MSGRVYELVAQRYPDITLESPVQGWVFLRDFALGINCYEQLTEATGEDDRWAGVCYFHLHQDLRSVELFYRAISKGVEPARINLAHALGYIERGDEVIPELHKVELSNLSPYDKALYHRVKSIHEETSGDLRTALIDAETAWQLVQDTPVFRILAPDIRSQLAIINSRIGKAHAAYTLIEETISGSTGVEHNRARVHRANIRIMLGQFDEALLDLQDLISSDLPDHFVPAVFVHSAEAEWALGNRDEAIRHFEKATQSAAELELGFEEFLAHIGLALLLGSEDDLDRAFEHLQQAELLVGDRSDRLSFRFREILIHKWAHQIDPASAVGELRTVAEELEKMGALQEQGWVQLHIVNELWEQGGPNFARELQALKDIVILLQNPDFLAREYLLVPRFAETFAPELRLANPGITKTLSIHTLGREELLLDGTKVEIPLRRSVELLAYLILQGDVHLDDVVRDLFPNYKFRTAKSYFHQFRFHLQRAIDGISVDYDRDSRTYAISSSIEITCDASTVASGPSRLSFLPSATSPWAIHFRERVETGTSPVREH